MDALPRDMQLEIIRKFDMDTRIKCGIIGRLKVPTDFLESKLKPPEMSWRNVPRASPPLCIHKSEVYLSPIYRLTYEGLKSKKQKYDIWSVLQRGTSIFLRT